MMELTTKDKALGAFLACLDGRDPRSYVMDMDGDECIAAHNVMKGLDDLLKAQWKLMGSPEPVDGVIL